MVKRHFVCGFNTSILINHRWDELLTNSFFLFESNKDLLGGLMPVVKGDILSINFHQSNLFQVKANVLNFTFSYWWQLFIKLYLFSKVRSKVQNVSFRNSLQWAINPLTPKISWVILLTVCNIVLLMLVWRIWYWIN